MKYLISPESNSKITYQVFHINVFTQQTYSGNGATVVWQSNGLLGNTMQILAREFNTSETIFIALNDVNDSNKNELTLRFFTPTQEVPSCGHGTIAAAHVANLMLAIPLEEIVFKTPVAKITLQLNQKGSPKYKFEMPVPKLENTMGVPQSIINAFNELDINKAYIVSTGSGENRLLLHCKNKTQLLGLIPDFPQLVISLKALDVSSVFIFTIDNSSYSKISARMFAPNIGINEDPVNGNSSVALSSVIFSICKDNGLKCPNTFTVQQGQSMNRSGTVTINLTYNSDSLLNVEMAGHAVELYTYQLTKLPINATTV
jgi:PhzF family phenazine biosynthesis protein